jgi:membrane protein DedA with SNARE-associated domain
MDKQRTKRAVWSWEATCALFCFAGGIGAALVGSVLTAMTWAFGAQLHPWLRGSGTALLIITIPLLIFSGYCMDWMERDRNKRAKGRAGQGEQGRTLN